MSATSNTALTVESRPGTLIIDYVDSAAKGLYDVTVYLVTV